jgi:hypothetical protein
MRYWKFPAAGLSRRRPWKANSAIRPFGSKSEFARSKAGGQDKGCHGVETSTDFPMRDGGRGGRRHPEWCGYSWSLGADDAILTSKNAAKRTWLPRQCGSVLAASASRAIAKIEHQLMPGRVVNRTYFCGWAEGPLPHNWPKSRTCSHRR